MARRVEELEAALAGATSARQQLEQELAEMRQREAEAAARPEEAAPPASSSGMCCFFGCVVVLIHHYYSLFHQHSSQHYRL